MGTHIVISLLQEALGDLNLPGCVAICDGDGLALTSLGERCDEMVCYACLLVAFEETEKQLERLEEAITSMIVSTSRDTSFFIHKLREKSLFVVFYTQIDTMEKVLPFLRTLVRKIERLLAAKEE